MFELIINQERKLEFTNGTTTESIKLFFKEMEDVTTTINLMLMGSRQEISFEIREVEEGEIYED